MKIKQLIVIALGSIYSLVINAHAVDDEIEEFTKQRIQYEQTRVLLSEKRFKELDKKMNALQQEYERGNRTSAEVLAGFRPFYDPSPSMTSLHDEWVKGFSSSYAAYLARAVHYKYVGRALRGGRWISETPEKQIKEMEQYLTMAMQDLKQSEQLTKKPLASYLHMMDIGMYLGGSKFNREMLEKGWALEPSNMILPRKFMYTLRPRWGGSFAAMDAFLDECKKRGTSAKDLRTLEAVILLEKGWVSTREKDYDIALGFYNRAVSLNPDDAELKESLWRRVDLNVQTLKKYAQAIPDLDRILAMDPESKRAYANRAYAYDHTKNFSKAFEDYKAAAELGDPWAQNRLGDMYWNGIGAPVNKQEAVKWFRRAAANGSKEGEENLKAVLKHGPKP